MKRAGRLMERILEWENLRLGFWKAAKGKRARSDAREYGERLEENLAELARDLREGNYEVGPYHQFTIHDPKERLITAPCFRDRVLHHAIMNVCEPIFDRFLIHDTYACRHGKGRIAAVERAWYFARRNEYFLKLDVRKYFDSISHKLLRERLSRRFKDIRLLELLGRIIEGYETTPGHGVPIGSLTSQHFANFYLGWLDRYVKETLRALGYVRYMDDFVVWGSDRAWLRQARDRMGWFLREQLCLDLREKTYINRCRVGMDFLGNKVHPGHIALNRRSRVRFQRRLLGIERHCESGSLSIAGLQQRAEALVAFARAGATRSWRWRDRVIGSSMVDGHGFEPGHPGR